jgi:universal stress protein A
MSGKILVPVDLSPVSQSVVDWAASLAKGRGASLVVLNVQEPVVDGLVGEVYLPVPIKENPITRRLLLALHPADKSVPVEHRTATGVACEQICQAAREEDADLIVMGSHGRTGLSRLLVGSVAESVMRHACCPVMIIKDAAAAAAIGSPRQSSTCRIAD